MFNRLKERCIMKKREYNNNIRRRLKRVREGQKISMRELGELIDVDYTAVSHWESGKRYPSEENSQKLEKIFEEPISELMKEDPDYEPRYLIEQTKKRI